MVLCRNACTWVRGESGRTTMACETSAGRSVTIRPPLVLASARRTCPHSQALKVVVACASKAVYCQKGGTWSGSVSSGQCASQGVCGRNTTSRPSWANSPASWATSHGRSKTAWLAILVTVGISTTPCVASLDDVSARVRCRRRVWQTRVVRATARERRALGFDRADMQEVQALLAELGGYHWRDLTSRQQCAQLWHSSVIPRTAISLASSV